MFELSKSKLVEANPTVGSDRSVNFAKMMDSLSVDVLTEINNCYYSNGTLNDDRADRALQSIKGKMVTIRHIVASIN